MSTVFKKTSEITTILKVVLCSLFVFFSAVFFISCSKFEEDNNQTQVVPNINEAQATIGGENIFENYVNIEDFRNQISEDLTTFDKHNEALSDLLNLNSFPKVRSKEDLSKISRQIYYTFGTYGRPANRSHYNSGKFSYYMEGDVRTEPYVECFLKMYVNEETRNMEYQLYLPKEVYHLSHEERMNRVHGGTYDYVRREVPVSVYCSLTGIPRNLIENLRVVTRQERDYSYWYYQMPYKDNYLDYQNGTQTVTSINDLKKFIKKGSLIFIFDKPLKDLDKIFNLGEFLHPNDKKWGIEYWGHMMITDWYTDKVNKYTPLVEYHLMPKNEDFYNIQNLHKKSVNVNISFPDYLKHFVFVEAQKDPMQNKNKEQGFERDNGVMLTSGNDERLQNYIKNATCVAVVNINDGYNYSHPNLVNTMINNALNQLGKEYNTNPTGTDIDTLKHYCSGLVFYSFLNGRKSPSLRLLKHKHISDTKVRGLWYMPRTVCNSPYVYTRVWYNN